MVKKGIISLCLMLGAFLFVSADLKAEETPEYIYGEFSNFINSAILGESINDLCNRVNSSNVTRYRLPIDSEAIGIQYKKVTVVSVVVKGCASLGNITSGNSGYVETYTTNNGVATGDLITVFFGNNTVDLFTFYGSNISSSQFQYRLIYEPAPPPPPPPPPSVTDRIQDGVMIITAFFAIVGITFAYIFQLMIAQPVFAAVVGVSIIYLSRGLLARMFGLLKRLFRY